MPTSNPYPERAIASFLLVGAMGVALFFIESPLREGAGGDAITAEQEPPARGNGTNPYPVVPDRINPPIAVAGLPPSGPVFSEAAVRRRAETPVTAVSAAPGRSQGVPSADPVPTPGPTTPPAEDRDPLLDVELDIEADLCATSILLLNDLLCR